MRRVTCYCQGVYRLELVPAALVPAVTRQRKAAGWIITSVRVCN